MTTELVAILVASFLTSFGSIIVAIITNRGAAHKSDVNALAETVATLQAENVRLRQRVQEQDARIDTLEAENSELSQLTQQQEARIRHMEDDNGDLRKWAEDLVCQVRELGGEPIQMKRTRKAK